MPIIENLSAFLEELTQRGYQYKIEIPITPQIQEGETCKLNALSVVLNSLNKHYGMPKPLPLRKKYEQGATYSLRQLAKEKYDSQVGEIYSAKVLAKIAADNGYDNSTIYSTNNYSNFVQVIIASINIGEAPIIFYDIDWEGEPDQFESKREHAVVVAGYFFNEKNELGFIISQWGQYYCVWAVNVFSSTSQLSTCKTPETFYKYGVNWYDLETIRRLSKEQFPEPPNQQRHAHALSPKDGGLKNKIFIIHNKPKILNKTSFWSSPLALTNKEKNSLFHQNLIRDNIPFSSNFK